LHSTEPTTLIPLPDRYISPSPLHKAVTIFLLCFLMVSCQALLPGTSDDDNDDEEEPSIHDIRLINNPAVVHQQPPPERIRSIELFRTRPGNPPVITLNSAETLTLRFDELANEVNSFTVRLRHYNSDWTESTLLSSFVNRGFEDAVITGGTPSVGQHPSYFSYSFTFPNRDFRMRVSGNFMLEVYDYATREKLFSLPFFVKEDRGRLDASISEYFRNSRFPNHQVFAEYYFPSFVSMPLIDIDVYIVQNQFWGRAKKATERDVSNPNFIRLHNTRDDGFSGRYEFRPLLIDDIYSISRNVLEVRPDRDPPLIRLNYDVIDLDRSPRSSPSYFFGQPRTGRNARYTEVEFNLDRPDRISQDQPVYVIGSFSNWNLSPEQRLEFNREQNAFTGRFMIKEGRYDYRYVVLENDIVDELNLGAFFADTSQDYQVLVYFRDQQEQYDRLLQFGSIRSR